MNYICGECIHRSPSGACLVPNEQGYVEQCEYFKEKPKHTKEQTNEEWLRRCSTEELARVLFCFFGDGVTFCERNYSNTHLFFTDDDFISDDSVLKWLKEKRE